MSAPGFDWRALKSQNLDFQLAYFGIDVTYTPSGGAASTKRGHLDTGPNAQLREPGIFGTLRVRLADFTSPPLRGDVVAIDGINYRVAKDPADTRDGAGGTYLYLRKI